MTPGNGICAACTRTIAKPRADDFTIGCESCKARALAATGAHEASQMRGSMTQEYKDALEMMFGERRKEGAALVKQWGKRIDAMYKRKVAV